MTKSTALRFYPVTKRRWHDLETLFGKNGACAGCWCMWFRMKRSEWEKQRGEANKNALKKLVLTDRIPGLLAYSGDQPVAWCCLGPREDFHVLMTSRILKPVDEQKVWSVVCFFVARGFRRKGVTRALLDAAASFAKEKGANMLEGYPIEPRKESIPDLYGYHGFASMFRKAGFREIARRSDTRPIMRKQI